MITEKISNYEKWCDEWRERFLKMDQVRLMSILPELKLEGDLLTLYHFGHKYGISRTTGEICSLEGESFVSTTIRLNIYTLFGYASPTAHFTDEWVPFENLKNTSPFAPAYRRGVLEPFARTFSGHLSKLQTACEKLGGERLSYSDAGYQLKAFDCIPVRFLFWEGDDEFPAQANTLFDTSATDYIHGESIVTIATIGLYRIAQAAGLPVDGRSFGIV